jgi:hypothetical protein
MGNIMGAFCVVGNILTVRLKQVMLQNAPQEAEGAPLALHLEDHSQEGLGGPKEVMLQSALQDAEEALPALHVEDYQGLCNHVRISLFEGIQNKRQDHIK